jgi:hypothetical protein
MKLIAASALMLLVAAPAFGGIQGNAAITYKTVAGGFEYDLTLNNTGNTTIGTLWFAWIPGYDFLPSAPTSVTSPAGWSDLVMNEFPGDGYSIQWVATTPMAAGSPPLSGFSFTTTDAPAAISGTNTVPSFFSGFYPTAETYVYIGQPEFDPGFAFVPSVTAAPAPEPAAISLLGIGAAGLLARRRRTKILSAN